MWLIWVVGLSMHVPSRRSLRAGWCRWGSAPLTWRATLFADTTTWMCTVTTPAASGSAASAAHSGRAPWSPVPTGCWCRWCRTPTLLVAGFWLCLPPRTPTNEVRTLTLYALVGLTGGIIIWHHVTHSWASSYMEKESFSQPLINLTKHAVMCRLGNDKIVSLFF